jgi:hypothetical protein
LNARLPWNRINWPTRFAATTSQEALDIVSIHILPANPLLEDWTAIVVIDFIAPKVELENYYATSDGWGTVAQVIRDFCHYYQKLCRSF